MRLLASLIAVLTAWSLAKAEVPVSFEQSLAALRGQVLATRVEHKRIKVESSAKEIDAIADDAKRLQRDAVFLEDKLEELRRRAQYAGGFAAEAPPPGRQPNPQPPRPQPQPPRPQPPRPQPPSPRPPSPQPPRPQPPSPRPPSPQPPRPQPPSPRPPQPQPPRPQPPSPRPPQPQPPRPQPPRPQPPQPRPPQPRPPRPQPPQPQPPRNPNYPRPNPGPYPYPYPGCPDPYRPCPGYPNPRYPDRDPWLYSDLRRYNDELHDFLKAVEDVEGRAMIAARQAVKDPALIEPAKRLLAEARALNDLARRLENTARFAAWDFRRAGMSAEGEEAERTAAYAQQDAENLEAWSEELLKKVSP